MLITNNDEEEAKNERLAASAELQLFAVRDMWNVE